MRSAPDPETGTGFKVGFVPDQKHPANENIIHISNRSILL